MGLKLPPTISSPQDLHALQLELREYKKWLSHAAIKQQLHTGKLKTGPELSTGAAQTLHSFTTSKRSITASDVEALIATLQKYESSAPSLTITLAAPPTRGIKEQLVAWCRDNIAPTVLVTFQFNSTLLGGMVIRYGSRIFDWSFRRQIMDNRAEFPEALRNV